MDKVSLFNPGHWGQAVGKMFSDVKDDNPIVQNDLRIVSALSFVGGMATQGARANNRLKNAAANGTVAKPFKAFLI